MTSQVLGNPELARERLSRVVHVVSIVVQLLSTARHSLMKWGKFNNHVHIIVIVHAPFAIVIAMTVWIKK